MKKYISLFAFSLTVIAFTTSCSSPEVTTSEFIIESTHFTRSGQDEQMTIDFQGQSISADIVDMKQMDEAEGEHGTEAQLLDVNFIVSDELVENGFFIFGIETGNAIDLTFEIFDQEGNGMVTKNKFAINEGSNYKALNVASMESGDYVFRLKDAQGRVLERTVKIAHKE